jgi:hypothetical protein
MTKQTPNEARQTKAKTRRRPKHLKLLVAARRWDVAVAAAVRHVVEVALGFLLSAVLLAR